MDDAEKLSEPSEEVSESRTELDENNEAQKQVDAAKIEENNDVISEEKNNQNNSSEEQESSYEQLQNDKQAVENYHDLNDEINKFQNQFKTPKVNRTIEADLLREQIAHLKAEFINLQSMRLLLSQKQRQMHAIDALRESVYDLTSLNRRLQKARARLNEVLERKQKSPRIEEERKTEQRGVNEADAANEESVAKQQEFTLRKAEPQDSNETAIEVMAALQQKRVEKEKRLTEQLKIEQEKKEQQLEAIRKEQEAKRVADQIARDARERIEKQRALGQLKQYQDAQFTAKIELKSLEMQRQREKSIQDAKNYSLAKAEEKERIKRQFLQEMHEKQLRKAALYKKEQEKQQLAAAERIARRKALEQRYMEQFQQEQPTQPTIVNKRNNTKKLVTLNGTPIQKRTNSSAIQQVVTKPAPVRARSQNTLAGSEVLRESVYVEMRRSYLQQQRLQEKAAEIQFKEKQKVAVNQAQKKLAELIRKFREIPSKDVQNMHRQIVLAKENLLALKECKTDQELQAVGSSYKRRCGV